MNNETVLSNLDNMIRLEEKRKKSQCDIELKIKKYMNLIEILCVEEEISLDELLDRIDEYTNINLEYSERVKQYGREMNDAINALKRSTIYNGRILFCKIGWAKCYNGSVLDKPRGGGSYNEKNIGHEILNFKPDRGKLYGYVQHSHGENSSQIKIEKICSSANGKEKVADTLVVWVSNNSDDHNIKIVGWYKNATVFRHLAECTEDSERYQYFKDYHPIVEKDQVFQFDSSTSYRVMCDVENSQLIHEQNRRFIIKKAKISGDGGIGTQSALWYAENSQDTIDSVINYIYSTQEFIDYKGKIDSISQVENLKGKDKIVMTKVRCNQGEFRELMLNKFDKCCLCNISNKNLLIASHIKPWSSSSSAEKLDESNGLLLCPQHDYLFDKGFISFDENGKIIISNSLYENEYEALNIDHGMSIKVEEDMKKYFEFHRLNIQK